MEALRNTSIQGYFNSTQALVDYMEVLIYIQKQLLAENSPIIVVGASYGGSKLPCKVMNLMLFIKCHVGALNVGSLECQVVGALIIRFPRHHQHNVNLDYMTSWASATRCKFYKKGAVQRL